VHLICRFLRRTFHNTRLYRPLFQSCNRTIYIDIIAYNVYAINVSNILIKEGVFAMIVTATELKANIAK